MNRVIVGQEEAGFRFEWNPANDLAVLREGDREFWRGSLLPLFWLGGQGGSRVAVPAEAVATRSRGDGAGDVSFRVGALATGVLHWTSDAQQFRFARLELTWMNEIRPIVGMYFGCAPLTVDQRRCIPTLERPFWPNWRAWGFAVPGAKTSPLQSFFRRWDFGHADIPLGSFGPAMGTPYGAAFPRPTFAAGMGDDRAVVVFGPGEIPDAALTLQIRSSSGCLEWRYREDLWGAPPERTRVWTDPLRATWDGSAWEACRRHFRALPQTTRPATAQHQKSFAGTWGDFRRLNFELPKTVDRVVEGLGGEVFCIDDPWESFVGSGEPHPERLPHFAEDLAYARSRGLAVGLWQPTLWVGDYRRAGLRPEDLLCGIDGEPVRTNWALDPHDPEKLAYCLDGSSAGALAYVAARTRRIMAQYRPSLLKLDFSYGGPGPDLAAPRHFASRGERGPWRLMQAIALAAKAVDPGVTLLGYSLSPLWDGVQDQVSLDDLGDAGPYEAQGHRQWSVWASLVGDRGLPILASSGYDWEADAEILLNTVVIGAPGMNLPRERADGSAPTRAQVERRLAVSRYFRRPARWTPLWLDSARGSFSGDPESRCWGRLERHGDEDVLTALALRPRAEAAAEFAELPGLSWTGHWALLSEGDEDLRRAGNVVAVAFGPGELQWSGVREIREVVALDAAGATPPWSWATGVFRLRVTDQTASAIRLVANELAAPLPATGFTPGSTG